MTASDVFAGSDPHPDLVSKLVGVNGGVWVSFVRPLVRQFSFSLEAFRSPMVQDFCPMLSFFFRPHLNRGFGPVRGGSDGHASFCPCFHFALFSSSGNLFGSCR